jgi:hypothetical protein
VGRGGARERAMVGGCAGGDGAAEGTLARWRKAAAKRIGLSCASFFSYTTTPSSPSSKTVCALLCLHLLSSCLQEVAHLCCIVHNLIRLSLFFFGSRCFVLKKTRFYVYLCKFLVDCSCVIQKKRGLHFIGFN